MQRLGDCEPDGPLARQRSVPFAACHPQISHTLTEDENDGNSERLNRLAAFQLKMIKHAMTCTTGHLPFLSALT